MLVLVIFVFIVICWRLYVRALKAEMCRLGNQHKDLVCLKIKARKDHNNKNKLSRSGYLKQVKSYDKRIKNLECKRPLIERKLNMATFRKNSDGSRDFDFFKCFASNSKKKRSKKK